MTIKKLIIGIIIAAVLTVVIITVLLSVLALHYKSVIEAVMGKALGAAVDVGSVNIDLKNRVLILTDFNLHNPKGFDEEEVLAYIPKIRGEYDLNSLVVNKKIHLTAMDMHVKTMVAVKNESGKLNVDQLAIFKEMFEEFPLQTD